MEVRHEAAQEMRVGPSKFGLQEQTSNRLKLHGSNAFVVSVEGKGTGKIMSGEVQGGERKRSADEVSKTGPW